jgi:hypothetical protein
MYQLFRIICSRCISSCDKDAPIYLKGDKRKDDVYNMGDEHIKGAYEGIQALQ